MSRLPLLLALTLIAQIAFCAEGRDLAGVSVSAPPKIDGKIQPEEWPVAARREGFLDKDTGTVSDTPVEFWLTYDAKYIYFAARVKTDPRKLVADQYRPNAGTRGDDNFTLIIDPTGGTTNYNSFSMSAGGGTQLGLAGGRAAKTEWVGEFETAPRLTETGWEIEARIPWKIMAIPAGGKRDLRWNVQWFPSEKQNTYEHFYTSNNPDKNPSWTGVTVPISLSERQLSLLPYGIIGAQKDQPLIADFGLDAKTSLTDRLTLVSTINPDFRNIENSILSLDFSYFERLADETRPFFAEGANNRRTGFDNRLFASQRLRKFEFGLNVYGALDNRTRVGILSATDFGESTANVVSVQSQLRPGEDLTLAAVTWDKRGERNRSAHAAFSKRVENTTYTVVGNITDDEQRKTGFHGYLGAEYYKLGIYGSIGFEVISPEFFPRIGFSREQDFKAIQANFGYEKTPSSGPILNHSTYVNLSTYERFNGGFYRNDINTWNGINFRNGLGLNIYLERGNFQGSSDHLYRFTAFYPNTNNARSGSIDIARGQFLGDNYSETGVSFNYRPVKRSSLSLRTQFVDYQGQRQQHILGFSYDLNRFESIGGRIVKSDNDWNWYVSYRLSGKVGNEFYLIVGDPNTDTFQSRILLKAVLPFSIKF